MLDLPEELWAKHILKHAGASELVRLQRVCRALHPLASHASYQPVIHAERERRASARQADRDRRRRDYLYNRQPAIVKAALECKMDSVVALLDSGVAVDECATWVETEEKYGGYDKSWTWKMDTALSIACSQGHLPMVQLLLARGANPEHRVCIQADVHYTPAAIARQNGHSLCADYMDRVIDALEAPRRAEHQQRAREASIKLREEARRLRTAGPPYPASAGGIFTHRLSRPRRSTSCTASAGKSIPPHGTKARKHSAPVKKSIGRRAPPLLSWRSKCSRPSRSFCRPAITPKKASAKRCSSTCVPCRRPLGRSRH